MRSFWVSWLWSDGVGFFNADILASPHLFFPPHACSQSICLSTNSVRTGSRESEGKKDEMPLTHSHVVLRRNKHKRTIFAKVDLVLGFQAIHSEMPREREKGVQGLAERNERMLETTFHHASCVTLSLLLSSDVTVFFCMLLRLGKTREE
jgi:hypothetical protein